MKEEKVEKKDISKTSVAPKKKDKKESNAFGKYENSVPKNTKKNRNSDGPSKVPISFLVPNCRVCAHQEPIFLTSTIKK